MTKAQQAIAELEEVKKEASLSMLAIEQADNGWEDWNHFSDLFDEAQAEIWKINHPAIEEGSKR